ncbi:hypothetical protein Tco_0455457 [Tanacetum coccineum]
MGKSSQTLRMLTNEQSLYRKNKRKIGLGYTDPCPLGQAIACHPKLYDAKVLGLHYVKPDVHDTMEILNDAEEKYFSNSSISNVSSELSSYESDVPPKEMPNEVLISRSLNECSTIIQQEITDEVKEMLDIFESMERNVERTTKKNEILQNKINQLLEANIANDVKILVMQSYVEIKNNEEIQQFSKESKDSEKLSNDVVEIKEKLSKQIIQLEKDFAKIEAQSIAFEIALQHKTQENNSLKMLQKENENFMASLQIENARLKQTYKDLFESVPSLRVETIQCDKVKIKKIDNLENAFADEVKRLTIGKLTAFDKENCDFRSKVIHLEKIIAQMTKDFDDVKLELTQLENLKGKSVETKFDKSLILGKPPADKLLITSQLPKSWSTPKVVVQKDLSKPVTAQSLPKNEKDQLLKQIAFLKSKMTSQDIRLNDDVWIRWIEDDSDNTYVYYLRFKSYGLMMDENDGSCDEGKAFGKRLRLGSKD